MNCNMKNRGLKITYWLILALIVGLFVKGYCQHTGKPDFSESGRYVVLKADKAYMDSKFSLAIEYYKQYQAEVDSDKISSAVLYRMADCYWQEGEFDECRKLYERLIAGGSWKASSVDQIRISNLFARDGHYNAASSWLKGVAGYEKRMQAFGDSVALKSMCEDSDSWKISMLKINPGYRVSAPVLVDSVLFFSSNRSYTTAKGGTADGSVVNQLYKVKPSTTMLLSVDSLEKTNSLMPINMVQTSVLKKRIAEVYEGADVAVQKRGKYAYKINQSIIIQDTIQGVSVVRGLDKKHSRLLAVTMDGDKNIYYSYSSENSDHPQLKQESINLPNALPVEHIKLNRWAGASSIMHPTINTQGTILIFSSNRPGGKGGYDLYVSTRTSKTEEWSIPQNLSIVNTTGSEIFPSLTQDGYLYFSSDNLPGLGGFDIYRIKLDDAIAVKGTIEHLSYPVNSGANDYGWTQYTDGISGYFASDRLLSRDRIFNFHYYPGVWLSGLVKNQLTGDGIENATVLVYDNATKQVRVIKTDRNGNYRVRVNKGANIRLRAVTNPYDTVIANVVPNEYSQCVTLENITSDQKHSGKALSLNKLKLGTTWTLDTIFYAFDKWNIRPSAYSALDGVVSLLKCYPLLHVEIRSYTDRRGSDEYNMWLSQQRANNVVKYIVKQGVDTARIKARGYGKTHFINVCPDGVPCSEKFHQVNRRTEISVIGFEKTAINSGMHLPDLTRYKDGDVLNIDSLSHDFFEQDTDCSDSLKHVVEKIQKKVQSQPEILVEKENNESDPGKQEKDEIRKMVVNKKEKPFVQCVKGEYVVQVAAFKSMDNALREMAKIKRVIPSQLRCFVAELAHNFYRVRIGYFKSYGEAVDILNIISQKPKYQNTVSPVMADESSIQPKEEDSDTLPKLNSPVEQADSLPNVIRSNEEHHQALVVREPEHEGKSDYDSSTKHPVKDAPIIKYANGMYNIQIGSFKSLHNALKKVAALKNSIADNLHCYVVEFAPNFYRVKVGFFKSYSEANAELEKKFYWIK